MSEDVWTIWNGGRCPVPTEEGIRARLRCGKIMDAYADLLEWQHEGNELDVIAYQRGLQRLPRSRR